MILRNRQKIFVQKSVDALISRGNTLGVAPTGSGKTLMLSAVVGQMLDGNGSKACILAHRDEITAQNIDKFLKINPGLPVSVVDAGEKKWDGKTVFAMVQTLSREKNLLQMPPLDLLVVDEAHHASAPTYARVVEAARRRNPSVRLYGVTATPCRGDKKGLRAVFDNVADQISLSEAIALGWLVKPRTFVIDLGIQKEILKVKRLQDDFDMEQVAEIIDRTPLTQEILRHWKEKAGDRRTVVFCSTVLHAKHVHAAFLASGVTAEMVTGETPDPERAGIFRRLDTGETQVLVNVAVATEGWDCPPISCVALLRPCSYKSTMIQMVGRGLRKLDPDRYPGMIKTDCIVLDFGSSAILHGTLEQDVDLDGAPSNEKREAPNKTCPNCGAEVPLASRECPLCGYEFQKQVKEALPNFEMKELDLLKKSPFKWCDFNDSRMTVATGFKSWSVVLKKNELWYAVGGLQEGGTAKVLQIGERHACLASADDWLNLSETETTAHKSRRWLREPATDKQILYMPDAFKNSALTRYEASCVLTQVFNRWKIHRALKDFTHAH